MKKLLVIFFISFLSGCATTEKYNAILDSWMGQDINKLINSWGYPDNSFEAPNGNRVYVYTYEANTYIPQTNYTTTTYNAFGNTLYGNSITNSYGGYSIYQSCTTYFEVNEYNIIVNWRWKGNACKAE